MKITLLQLQQWIARDDLAETLTDLFGDHGRTLWYRYYNKGDHNFSRLLHTLDRSACSKIEESILEYDKQLRQ